MRTPFKASGRRDRLIRHSKGALLATAALIALAAAGCSRKAKEVEAPQADKAPVVAAPEADPDRIEAQPAHVASAAPRGAARSNAFWWP